MQATPELEIARNLPPSECSVADAQRYTRWLATHHYENFHVASLLLPRRLRQHFFNVYAYCRWADDLGDEVDNVPRALELLDDWERELDRCYEGCATHPVFIALAPTIAAFEIPIEPFRDLLTAFRQDQTVHRYDTWEGVLGYCRYSANPVGRLVLYLCGYRDAQRQRLSDATCTALQLANFWQDVSRDLDKGRIYIPLDALARNGLSPDDIEARHFDARYTTVMKELVARTRGLFAEGQPLAATLDSALRVDIELFSAGGIAVLDAIEAMGYNTLQHRPAIGAATRAQLLGKAIAGRIGAALEAGSGTNAAPPMRDHSDSVAVHGSPGLHVAEKPAVVASSGAPEVAASYTECLRVARAASSNFYYAFYMLPRPKRDALCALYAFMRLVDDASDAPAPLTSQAAAGKTSASASEIVQRRAALAHWRALLDRAVAGDTSGHPILPAFADTIHRFGIPQRYFHDLISGAEMDLTEPRYATFERLREYCYRVAGTVGLTCLHVFGFEDPHAPELAEQLGIAFQLTNIIRDVAADLAMGRVYLPEEDLSRFACTQMDLARGVVTPAVHELLRAEANRAWQFYAQGARLVRRVDRDSRAALWALARTYSTLLVRIEERGFDVFSSRVRLTAGEKARILFRARVGWWSEADVLEDRDRDRRRLGGIVRGRRAG